MVRGSRSFVGLRSGRRRIPWTRYPRHTGTEYTATPPTALLLAKNARNGAPGITSLITFVRADAFFALRLASSFADNEMSRDVAGIQGFARYDYQGNNHHPTELLRGKESVSRNAFQNPRAGLFIGRRVFGDLRGKPSWFAVCTLRARAGFGGVSRHCILYLCALLR